MKQMAYTKPQLAAFDGWDALFAEGGSFDPPDPGCLLPGLEDDCADTGVVEG